MKLKSELRPGWVMLGASLFLVACGAVGLPGAGPEATQSGLSEAGPTDTQSELPEAAQSSVAAPSLAPSGSESSTSDLVQLTVVDGDTVKLPSGARIRIIGIDTPERRRCGYNEASDALRRMVAEGARLSAAPSLTTDKFGRLLRYVETPDGLDAGEQLLRDGLAVARYDSLDGYPGHPKQSSYRSISEAVEPLCPTEWQSGG